MKIDMARKFSFPKIPPTLEFTKKRFIMYYKHRQTEGQSCFNTSTAGIQTQPSAVFGCKSCQPGDRCSTVVKVLCYKSEGRWFDPSWCQ